MLPPAHRMRRGADFTLTTRNGAKVVRGRVAVYVHLTSHPDSLIGLIVGKAVGNSVVRHRVSRRLRAAVSGLVDDLPAGSRVVLRALPGAEQDAGLTEDVVHAITLASRRAGSHRVM
jgi:ribonuclease P protein component